MNKLINPVTAALWNSLEASRATATLDEIGPLLAKTADGITIEPGMTVYRANLHYIMGRTALSVASETFTATHGTLLGKNEAKFYGYRFFSTVEAACAAADAEADEKTQKPLKVTIE